MINHPITNITLRSNAKNTLIISCFFALLGTFSNVLAQEITPISGVTEPIHDLTLTLPVSGAVAALHFKEGAHVHKGEVIVELDKKLEELEVQRRKLIWESKAELNSATARVKTLSNQLKASKELFNSTGSISLEELEKQQLDYEIAVAEQQRLEAAESKEKIEYEMAVEQLNKRVLRSPINGIVTKLFLDIGETSDPDKPLIQLVDVECFVLVCNVEESIGGRVKKGKPVEIRINAGDEPITKMGEIIYVSPVVEPASGLQTIKAMFENKDGKVQPGVSGSLLL